MASGKNTLKSSGSEAKEESQASFQVVDKRHFVDLDHIPVEAAVEEKPRYPTFVEELMSRLSETERRFEEKKRQIDEEIGRTKARLQADFNRQLQLEKQNLILPFLEVLDNLERALNAAPGTDSVEGLREGLELTAGLFRGKLQAQGVEPLPVLNQPFDPNLGQAVGIVPVADSSQDGIVLEEVLRGYRMGDQLIRPAQVRVGRYQQDADDQPDQC